MTIWGLIENEKVIIKIALHEKNNGNTIRLYVWILRKLPILGYPLLDGRQSAPV